MSGEAALRSPRAFGALLIRRQRAALLIALVAGVAALTGVMILLGQALSEPFASQVHADLEWRALRGARELSKTTELGAAVIDEALAAYAASPDVAAIAVEVGDLVIANRGEMSFAQVFAAKPGQLVYGDGYVASWAAASPGAEVGKVAVVVSTRRLADAQAMQRRLARLTLIAGAAAAVLGALVILLLTRRVQGEPSTPGVVLPLAAPPLGAGHSVGGAGHSAGGAAQVAGDAVGSQGDAVGSQGDAVGSPGDAVGSPGDAAASHADAAPSVAEDASAGTAAARIAAAASDAAAASIAHLAASQAAREEIERLTEQLDERTQELDERRRGMRLLLDQAAQGFIMVDLRGRLDERSASVDRWFGEPAADATLASYLGAHGDELAAQLLGGLENIREGVETVPDALDAMPRRIAAGGNVFSIQYAPLMNGERPEKILLTISEIVEPAAGKPQAQPADEDQGGPRAGEPQDGPHADAPQDEPHADGPQAHDDQDETEARDRSDGRQAGEQPADDPQAPAQHESLEQALAQLELGAPAPLTPAQRARQEQEQRDDRALRQLAALTQLITGDRAERDEFAAEAAGLVAALGTPSDPEGELRTLRTLRNNCAYYGLDVYVEQCQAIESQLVADGVISDEQRVALAAGWAEISAQLPDPAG